MVWHELFPHTSIWVLEEGQEFENFSKNSSGKKQASPLLAPVKKLLEKSTSGPP